MTTPRSPSEGTRRLVGIFGNSGTGKTLTLRAVMRGWSRRLCFDRSAELAPDVDVHAVARSRGEVLSYLRGIGEDDDFSLAYQPGIMEPEFEAIECGFLARLALAARNCVLTIDEASRSCRNNLVDPAVVQVALEGRKRSVSMLLASQRPVHIDPDIRGEAYGSEVYLFRLARRADRREAEEEHGQEFADKLARLRDLHGYHITQASGGARIVPVTVKPNTREPRVIEGRRR